MLHRAFRAGWAHNGLRSLARTPCALHPGVRSLTTNPPPSTLTYYALLRNLRLLAGLRGDKTRFAVALTGLGSRALANDLTALEPSLDIEVMGEGSVDVGACTKQGRLSRARLVTDTPFLTPPLSPQLRSPGNPAAVWTR